MTRLSVLTAVVVLAVVVGLASQAAGQDLFGSVAFSTEPDGGYAWGIAWDHGSQEGARNRAVAACRERGGSLCQEQMAFLNGCGALFIGDGNGWGLGKGGSRRRAEAQAREACGSVNENCRLAVSQCTSEPGSAAEVKSQAGGFDALYGSIAFSQEATGGYAWGISWDHDNPKAAAARAVAACRAQGGAFCAERLPFRNGCGALVVASPNRWVVAQSGSQAGAETRARERCLTSTSDCQLAVSQCTSPAGAPPAVTALAGGYQPPSAPVRQATETGAPRRAPAREPDRARREPGRGDQAAAEPRAPQPPREPERPEPLQRGTLRYSDGSQYEGEHRGGLRHGRGTYTWVDGNRYEGEWHEDKMHGQGRMTWHYGDQYEGEYRDGQRHGRGSYTWADGRRFEGEWQKDEPVR